jgi:hypothetical protein
MASRLPAYSRWRRPGTRVQRRSERHERAFPTGHSELFAERRGVSGLRERMGD